MSWRYGITTSSSTGSPMASSRSPTRSASSTRPTARAGLEEIYELTRLHYGYGGGGGSGRQGFGFRVVEDHTPPVEPGPQGKTLDELFAEDGNE